jgi:hypothetical protein
MPAHRSCRHATPAVWVCDTLIPRTLDVVAGMSRTVPTAAGAWSWLGVAVVDDTVGVDDIHAHVVSSVDQAHFCR